MLNQTRWTSTFLRWWFRMMEVVQAEVWRPNVGISWFCLLARDDGGGSSRSLRTSWGVRVDGLAWLPEWFSTCPDVSYLSCACSRSCTRDPRLDCLAWRFRFLFSLLFMILGVYIYRIIHVLCQEKIQCLLLGGFSVL